MFNRRPPTNAAAIGHAIFEQLETVVMLKEKKWIWDSHWMEILQYTWTGDHTVDNISKIQKLIVTEPDCNVPNFNKDLWSSAILVTSRYGVRNLWNTPAIKRHWGESGNILYTFNVENSVGKDRRCLSHA